MSRSSTTSLQELFICKAKEYTEEHTYQIHCKILILQETIKLHGLSNSTCTPEIRALIILPSKTNCEYFYLPLQCTVIGFLKNITILPTKSVDSIRFWLFASGRVLVICARRVQESAVKQRTSMISIVSSLQGEATVINTLPLYTHFILKINQKWTVDLHQPHTYM